MSSKHQPIRLITSFRNAWKLILGGHYSVLFQEFKNRLHSEYMSFGLQRDLNKPFEAPAAKIKLKIRPLKEEDIDVLLDNSGPILVNPRTIANQRAIIEAKIPTCYVAATTTDQPCYMQWLISFKDNDKIKTHFRGVFPPLKKDEALLEAAYCSPAYRGLRIMPAAMAQIAEKAALLNARWVNTFVDVTNIPSLKGCRRSGFEPYILRKGKWFLFRHTVSYHSIPEELLERYHIDTADNFRTDTGNIQASVNKEPKVQS